MMRRGCSSFGVRMTPHFRTSFFQHWTPPKTATEAVDAAECTAIPYSFHATKGGFGGVEGLEAGIAHEWTQDFGSNVTPRCMRVRVTCDLFVSDM